MLGLEEERTAGRMLGSVIGGFASIGRIIKGMGKGGAGAVVGGVADLRWAVPGAAAGALAGAPVAPRTCWVVLLKLAALPVLPYRTSG